MVYRTHLGCAVDTTWAQHATGTLEESISLSGPTELLARAKRDYRPGVLIPQPARHNAESRRDDRG